MSTLYQILEEFLKDQSRETAGGGLGPAPSAGAALMGPRLPPCGSRGSVGEVRSLSAVSAGALTHLDGKPAPSPGQEAATPGWGPDSRWENSDGSHVAAQVKGVQKSPIPFSL